MQNSKKKKKKKNANAVKKNANAVTESFLLKKKCDEKKKTTFE